MPTTSSGADSSEGGETPAARAKQAFPGAAPKERGSLADRHRAGRPLTALDVENELLRLVGLLEDRTDELAGRARLAAEAEANHKGRWASIFLRSEGTESKRKAAADVETHNLYLERKISEGLYQTCKESCNSIRAQLDALRTISANIRGQT